jgi:hypothetical protein
MWKSLPLLLLLVVTSNGAAAPASVAAPPDARVLYLKDWSMGISLDDVSAAAAPAIVVGSNLGAGGGPTLRFPARTRRLAAGGMIQYTGRRPGAVCNAIFSGTTFTALYLKMKGDPLHLFDGTEIKGWKVAIRTLTFDDRAVTRATVDGVDVPLGQNQ